MWTGFFIGFVFGAMLHRSGVVRYSRITGALLLRDFKALKFMFTGVAVASIIYASANLANLPLVPRINGYFGLGHVIGGVLFGVGMAFGGLCPGTCAARFGAGKTRVGVALIGVFLGVFAYDAFFPLLSNIGGEVKFLTLNLILNISYGYVALAFGVMFLAMCFLLDRFDPAKSLDSVYAGYPWWRREWSWLTTGIVAGGMIALATYLGEYLSFAGGFLAIGAHIASVFGHPFQSVPNLSASTAWRAMLVLGVIPGGYVSSLIARTTEHEDSSALFREIFGPGSFRRVGVVFISGFLMSVGALIGGGCTTGAFMSAWPTLSLGSFAMGMTFFGTAMATIHLLYWRRWSLVKQVKAASKLSLAND